MPSAGRGSPAGKTCGTRVPRLSGAAVDAASPLRIGRTTYLHWGMIDQVPVDIKEDVSGRIKSASGL